MFKLPDVPNGLKTTYQLKPHTKRAILYNYPLEEGVVQALGQTICMGSLFAEPLQF